jgi:hypothetical protein
VPEYVYAVCPGDTLSLPAQLVSTFEEGIEIARAAAAQRTGGAHSVFPLKAPDWQGLCGNCGQPWRPHCPPPTYCPDAVRA